MLRVSITLLIAAACAYAQTQSSGMTGLAGSDFDFSVVASLRIKVGTAAPSAGDCNAAAEVGRFYLRSDAPATANSQLYICRQDGASSYGWHPASYHVGDTAPAKCSTGEAWFDSNATAGSNWFGCTAADTWTLLSGAAASVSGNGIVSNNGGTLTGRTITEGTGIDVTNGTGVSGNPTIAAEIASNAEALAATSNTVLMTPLRTKELFDAHALPATTGLDGVFLTYLDTAVAWTYKLIIPPSGTQTIDNVADSISMDRLTVEFDSDAARTLTSTPSFSAGDDGQHACVVNVGSFALTVQDESVLTGSGILLVGATTLAIEPNESVCFLVAGGKWIKTGKGGGAGSSTFLWRPWMPAAGCDGTNGYLLWDTLASNAPTAFCSAGTTETTMIRGVAQLPDSDGDYSLQQTIVLPADFTGAIDVLIKWRSSATSGNVVWQVATSCMSDGELQDVAYNTASTVTDTAKGTTLLMNDATITGVTATGCVAGDIMSLKVFRNRTHASDTITGVINFFGLQPTIRRTM